MNKFLLPIDQYINDETPGFRQLYNWFQDAYFGDQDSKVRDRLPQDEIDFLNRVNDLLAYAAPIQRQKNEMAASTTSTNFNSSYAPSKAKASPSGRDTA
jgi:hypothetical protein